MRSIRVALVIGITACGGDDGGGTPDSSPRPPDAAIADAAVPDAVPSVPDASPPDASAPDAAPGVVPDFEVCFVDADCMNPNSDCRSVPFLQGMPSVCMPQCAASTDCPFHTFCYPLGGGSWGPVAAQMGEHCWYSLCGEVFGGSQQTGAPCMLGAEAGAVVSDQLPGFCFPVSDGFFGQCIEVGAVAPGGACDSLAPVRGGANCDATGICVSDGAMPAGTCAQLCQPQHILTGMPTGCTTAGETCFDSSGVPTYSDGSTTRQTFGFCDDVVACGLIGPNPCPAAPDGSAQGCQPTNPLRPTGICTPAGGTLAVDAACPDPSTATTDAEQCESGTLCGAGMQCGAICKTAPQPCTVDGDCQPAMSCVMSTCTLPYPTGPDQPCAPGESCTALLWDAGGDGVLGTTDDVNTSDWGTCQ